MGLHGISLREQTRCLRHRCHFSMYILGRVEKERDRVEKWQICKYEQNSKRMDLYTTTSQHEFIKTLFKGD